MKLNPQISEFLPSQYQSSAKQVQTQQSNQKQAMPNQSIYLQSQYQCRSCCANLQKVTSLMKTQIQLQYQNQLQREQLSRLNAQLQHLTQRYQSTLSEPLTPSPSPFPCMKQDLQAQLSQSKFLIQLLLLERFEYNPIKGDTLPDFGNITVMELKDRYHAVVIENLRLQEKVMVRDRVIQDKELYPLYHYDDRVILLRRAVEHWCKKANQVEKVKGEVKKIKDEYHTFRNGVMEEFTRQEELINNFLRKHKKAEKNGGKQNQNRNQNSEKYNQQNQQNEKQKHHNQKPPQHKPNQHKNHNPSQSMSHEPPKRKSGLNKMLQCQRCATRINLPR